MEERFNRDIYPVEAALFNYTPLKPILNNEEISNVFALHERAAKRYKIWYQSIGLVALLSGYLASVALVVELHVDAGMFAPRAADAVLFLIGAVALTSLLLLLVQNAKSKWLQHRFVAEYLRCGKFQLFLALGGSSAPLLEEGVARKTAELLHEVSTIHEAPASILRRFQPDLLLDRWRNEPHGTIDPDLLAVARRAYREFRVNVQLDHFSAREDERAAELRIITSLGDFCLAGGVALSALELLRRSIGVPVLPESTIMTIGALALALFVTSATVMVFNRGRTTQADRERYVHYAGRVQQASQGLDSSDAGEFLHIVAQVERACAAELSEFYRQGARGSFAL